MAWEIKNEADVYNAKQSGIYNSALDDLVLGALGQGVYSGGAVTWNSGQQFAVASGAIVVGRQRISFSSTTKTTTYASGDPYIAIISVNNAGTVTLTEGTAAVSPMEPELPSANDVKLAALWVDNTTLAANRISDRRVFVPDPSDPNVRIMKRINFI